MPRPRRHGTASDATSETDLGDLVMRVARALRHRGAQAMAPWDLAPHHARALRVVGRHDGIRPGELAGHLRVAPRSVTDVVDALEERGLLERRPDPADRRATVLALTASGRALVAEVDAARRADAHSLLRCAVRPGPGGAAPHPHDARRARLSTGRCRFTQGPSPSHPGSERVRM